MSLNLSTDSLRSLLTLSEKRDALLAELQKIETDISKGFGSGTAAFTTTASHKTGNGRSVSVLSAKATKGKKASAKRGRRGAVKELILAGLREAGEAGIAVKHLAAKLAIKPQNLHVWFHTTGKKTGLTEALGTGVYRLKESLKAETQQAALKAPKFKATIKGRKAVRRSKKVKRGVG